MHAAFPQRRHLIQQTTPAQASVHVKRTHKHKHQVRKQRAKAGARMKKQYKLEDVVHQPKLPNFHPPAIIEAIRYFFRKRTVLRPEEKPSKVVLSAPTSVSPFDVRRRNKRRALVIGRYHDAYQSHHRSVQSITSS